MSKHTPGPWVARQGDARFADDWCIGLEGDLVPIDYVAVSGKANARLIAAAPELLDALMAVVSVADRATVEFDKARAAIAKATGATP